MIVRSLEQTENTDRHVSGETWSSRRLLLSEDGMGFSLHDTIIHAGSSTEMHYQNHLEAVYCIEGTGTLTEVDSGAVHALNPGTVYALNANDKHILKANTTMRMICVFNPALVGPETHDGSGAYPLLEAAQ